MPVCPHKGNRNEREQGYKFHHGGRAWRQYANGAKMGASGGAMSGDLIGLAVGLVVTMIVLASIRPTVNEIHTVSIPYEEPIESPRLPDGVSIVYWHGEPWYRIYGPGDYMPRFERCDKSEAHELESRLGIRAR